MSTFWKDTIPTGYYDNVVGNKKYGLASIQANWHKITFENVKMSRSSQGEAYYRSLDPDNDWAPFRYGFTFSGSRGVVLNDVEVYNTRGGLVLYDGENEVSVNNMLISGTGESIPVGSYNIVRGNEALSQYYSLIDAKVYLQIYKLYV